MTVVDHGAVTVVSRVGRALLWVASRQRARGTEWGGRLLIASRAMTEPRNTARPTPNDGSEGTL